MVTIAALWVDASNAAGSYAAVLGLGGGIVLALRYSRRASVTVTAELHEVSGGAVIAVRPTVRDDGVFPLTFLKKDGATVTVTEMILGEDGKISDGEPWPGPIFDRQFVEGGETLTTSVLFPLRTIPPNVIGWRVSVEINVRRWLHRQSSKPWSWSDRVFVPRPLTTNVATDQEVANGEETCIAQNDQSRDSEGNQEGEGSNPRGSGLRR